MPLFTRQAARCRQIQTAIGLYKEDNLIDRFRGGLRIFSVLITWALENGVITADSMTARGYGIGKRSHFPIFRFRKADIFLLAATGLLLAATLVSIGSGALDFSYYPSIRPAPASPMAAAGYLSYGLLIILPAVAEAEEKLRWKYLQSKI